MQSLKDDGGRFETEEEGKKLMKRFIEESSMA